jgi:hypothetical protein
MTLVELPQSASSGTMMPPSSIVSGTVQPAKELAIINNVSVNPIAFMLFANDIIVMMFSHNH